MLILASASPRRQELLQLITQDFIILPTNLVEPAFNGGDPQEYVKSLAYEKAAAIRKEHPEATIIGADTIVFFDGKILGKPVSQADAVRMLQTLSGKVHTVYTGVSIVKESYESTFSVATKVEFLPLSNEEIRAYVETGEPSDKAGAYGIQGKGSLFVKRIDGDFYNVVGLPVSALQLALRSLQKEAEKSSPKE